MSSEGFRDYYKILGIKRNSEQKDIKTAFRNLARKYHPDINPGDKKSESKFKEINEAYEVLSDPDKRAKYEQFGQYWNQATRMGNGTNTKGLNVDFDNYGNFDDFINDLLGRFGGVTSGNGFYSGSAFETNSFSRSPAKLDASIKLKVSFYEAFHGTERTLSINKERVQVKIPRGIKSGSRLRIKGKGNFQPGKGRRGDLFLNLDIEPHDFWKLEGDQLRGFLPISFDEMALGAKVKILIPDGEAEVNIPPGIMPGQNLRLKGKGWPSPQGRGDLLLTLQIFLPSKWSEEELDIINKLRNIRSFDPRKDWINSSKL